MHPLVPFKCFLGNLRLRTVLDEYSDSVFAVLSGLDLVELGFLNLDDLRLRSILIKVNPIKRVVLPIAVVNLKTSDFNIFSTQLIADSSGCTGVLAIDNVLLVDPRFVMFVD